MAHVIGLDMRHNFNSWWDNRCSVVIELAKQLFSGGQLWVDAQATEKIESEYGLWD